MSKKLRVTKNGHYSDCLLSSIPLITDINVKCRCGRPLPATLGCAVGRVLCGPCYTDLCGDREYNRNFSLCLNRRLDRHAIDPDKRQMLEIDGVDDYIRGVPECHFHHNLVDKQRTKIQKQKQIEEWQEAEALALFWRNNDPGSYHDSESDDSIVDNEPPSVIIDLVEDNDSEIDNESPQVLIDLCEDNVAPIDLPDFEPPRKRRRLIKKSELEEKKDSESTATTELL